MKQKKLATITLVAATAVLGSGVSVNALPAVTSTDYTITIPATLEVANAGWNATDGITAQVKSGDTFDSSKKLTVTASSDDEFALVSGENKVGYNLATATGTYSATAEVPVWEFSATDLNADGGKTNPMGIIVEDYSNKPAGTYQDTVTFTAKVEDAAPATVLSGALVDGAIIKVNFKWRGDNSGDYVQGTYNADSGTFTVSKGGSNWGTEDRRAVYKVEKSGDNIIIGAGLYEYTDEGMVWTFNTTNDTYTTTNGDMVNDMPGEFGLISVTLNGTDITSQLTKQ